MFTDQYLGQVDYVVYFVILSCMKRVEKGAKNGRGGGVRPVQTGQMPAIFESEAWWRADPGGTRAYGHYALPDGIHLQTGWGPDANRFRT